MFTSSLQTKYKLLHNKVRSATRLDFQTNADSITNNSQKAFWNWINKFRFCQSPIPPMHHHDGVVLDDCTIADLFNKYFVSVFTKENLSSLPDTPSFSPNVNCRLLHLKCFLSYLLSIPTRLVDLMGSVLDF